MAQLTPTELPKIVMIPSDSTPTEPSNFPQSTDNVTASSTVCTPVDISEFDDDDSVIRLPSITVLGNTTTQSRSQSKKSLYSWKKLIFNRIFCSRIIVIPPALFILFLCICYTISSLLQLRLDNYWCDSTITLQQIRDHSMQQGLSGGIRNECWGVSDIRNFKLLWSRQSYDYEWIYDSTSIFGLSMLLTLTIVLAIFVIYFVFNLIIDIIKYRKGTLSVPNKAKSNAVGIRGSRLQQSPCKKVFIWYRQNCAVDSANWIIMKVMGEIFEILTQTVALWAYNGTSITQTSTIYLAYEKQFVYIFTIFLFLNCVLCTALWLFYALQPKLCHGLLFQLLLVSIDTIFDIFYAFFPMIPIIVNNQNEEESYQNILVSLASLESGTLLSTCRFYDVHFLCLQCATGM